MGIDETGGDHPAAGIDLLGARAEVLADGGDALALDGDIPFACRASAPVDYQTVPNDRSRRCWR
jgi:hypothetical protein